MTAARMGRPPKDPEERYTASLRVRMTEEDHAQLKEAASAKGLSVSEWARGLLLRAARRILR